MPPFFSFIVPIYNVSHFIESGIDYLLNQSYKDFEIILVNDGSTDDSGKKCDYLSSIHENVHCFHQDNKGSGPARNLGIKRAKGRYIVFFDIDDRIEESLLKTCYDELNDKNFPDVFMFSYDSYDVKFKTLTQTVFADIQCLSNHDIRHIYVDHLLGLKKLNGFVWNKVYKRDFLVNNRLEFPSLLIQQDEVFNLHVYRKASSLVISSQILYHYIVYDNGNTRSRFIPERLNIYNTVKNEFLKLYNDWNLKDERMLVYVYRRFFNSIVETMNFNNTHKSSNLNFMEKNNELRMIITCDDTKDCIGHLEKLDAVPSEFFSKLYFKTIKKQNFRYYKMIRFFDKMIKSLKWIVKKHLI